MTNIQTCLIWNSYATYQDLHSNEGIITVIDSARAGGRYQLDPITMQELRILNPTYKAFLTSMLIDRRLYWNVEIPRITLDLIQEAKNKQALSVDIRLSRLTECLKILSEFTIGKPIILHKSDIDPNISMALAWSESVEITEVDMLLDHLIRESLVEEQSVESHLDRRIIRLSIKGWDDTKKHESSTESDQCFVAMWIDDSMNDLYEQGIEPAIKKAGYSPLLISRKTDIVNKIDDEIMKEIRRSKFVISDFTHGCKGARGSVYFEAGFAVGMHIPVIFTCRNDIIDKLHFDTRQYPHIVWYADDLDKFSDALYDRMIAILGQGPVIQ